MNQTLPVAVIVGIHRFGASLLVDELVKNDIYVIGVGEYVAELSGRSSFEFATSVSEVMRADYVFDFEGKKEVWGAAENWSAKLEVVEVNGYEGENKDVLVGKGVDWRVVRLYGVYGEGMLGVFEKMVGLENLVPVMMAAVKNQNLELPEKGSFRLLDEEEAVEVVLRSIFLSGTSGEVVDVWGAETRCSEIAEVLIENAKMTRKRVVDKDLPEREIDEGYVLKNWEKIRWQPRVKFGQNIEKTLQYLFRIVDEESRREKNSKIQILKSKKEEEVVNKNRRFEVVIENNEKLKINNEELEEKKPKEDLRIKMEVVEDEEKVEFKPIKTKTNYELLINNYEQKSKNDIKSPIPERKNNDQLLITNYELEDKKTKEPEKKNDVKRLLVNEKKKLAVKFPDFNFGGKKWWVVGVLVAVLLLVGGGVYGQYLLVKQTVEVKELIMSKKYPEAEKLISKLEKKINNNEEAVTNLGLAGTLWGRRYLAVARVWREGLELGKESVALVKRSELITNGILKDKEVNWKKEFEGLELELGAIEEKSGILQARMMGDWSWIPARWRGKWQSAVETIGVSREIVGEAREMVEVLPKMIGAEGKRKEYLVLLQNEMELRPNGGFIGSYGILSFDSGKLVNFGVSDVYQTDGQLKGHVEPPAPIKKYLGEGGWFLRDANWSADFNQSSKDIQWFFEKETGRKVDGVIGINLSMAKAILSVVGEVYVPDFREKINSNNLYEQAEYYSETKSFAGSTQKASFLGGLSKQLFEEIKNLDSDKRLKMVETVVEMLRRNEIQLAINDKTVAEKMARNGWDGGVYKGKCAQARCFADYLYILEANLGVNKANYFLYRSVEQQVDVGLNSISRVLKISYENTSKSNAWPGGDYKNYLRIYVPETANLAEVSVLDDVGVKTVIGGDDLVVRQVLGKKEIGFLVVVPNGKKRQVEVRYVDAVDLSKSEKFSYLNYIQRQSGFGDTGMVNLVSVPEGWQVTQVEPEASLVKGKVLFNQKLIKDIKMGVEISK